MTNEHAIRIILYSSPCGVTVNGSRNILNAPGIPFDILEALKEEGYLDSIDGFYYMTAKAEKEWVAK